MTFIFNLFDNFRVFSCNMFCRYYLGCRIVFLTQYCLLQKNREGKAITKTDKNYSLLTFPTYALYLFQPPISYYILYIFWYLIIEHEHDKRPKLFSCNIFSAGFIYYILLKSGVNLKYKLWIYPFDLHAPKYLHISDKVLRIVLNRSKINHVHNIICSKSALYSI